MKWLIFNLAALSLICAVNPASASESEPDGILQNWDFDKTELPSISSFTSRKDSVTISIPTKHRCILDRRVHRGRKGWERLIPTHFKWQYAGGMGFMSFGFGWDYGKKSRWETDLFFGFLPKSKSDRFYLTSTLKQNYIPWNISIKDRFSVDPFYCGLYINTIFGKQFWVKQPDRFPKKYYTFATKIHTYLFVGQRFTINTNLRTKSHMKGITFYYELSSCDLYLFSYFGNKYLSLKDVLGLSFGIKLQLF